MKHKISIVIDAEIVRLAKKQAAEQQRTLSGLIQEALAKHLRETRGDAQGAEDGVPFVLRTTNENTAKAASLYPQRRCVEPIDVDDEAAEKN